LKITLVLAILVLLVILFFFYQGYVSSTIPPPSLSGGELSACGSRPNCVSSVQEPSDEHYIEPIIAGASVAADASVADEVAKKVVEAIESSGGKVISNNGIVIQATFTSRLFKFVDDVQIRIDSEKLQVRSSSRVGHSDFGSNRKRIELLRQVLS